MKKLITLLVIVAGAYLAYQYLQKKDLAILEKGELTPAQVRLKECEERFQVLRTRFDEGQITSGTDVEAARNDAERIATELKELRNDLTSNRDKTKVAQLLLEIRKYKDEIL